MWLWIFLGFIYIVECGAPKVCLLKAVMRVLAGVRVRP